MTDTQKAVFLSLTGFFLFSLGDAIRKFVMLEHTAREVQLCASFFSVVTILIAARFLGGISSITRINHPAIHIIKSILVTILIVTAIYALERLQLDVFYTMVFTIPLLTSLLAAIFMKERLTLVKILLILIGFSGAVIAIRPGSTTDMVGVGLAFLLALSFAANALLNKLFHTDEPKFPFGFFPFVLATLTFLFINYGQIPEMSLLNLGLCFLAGAGSVTATVLHVHAFQLAYASKVAPYQYSQLIWGVMFGYFLFGDVPDIWVLTGAAIIIASGLAIFHYDRRQRKVAIMIR